MPASLTTVKFRGIRSYSSQEKRSQVLDFMPLTLIVGPNGTGKTTIIEALKFIISGEEPPLSDCRRNFVNSTDSKKPSSDFAQIELQFTNSTGEHCTAKRSISGFGPGKSLTPAVTSSYKLGKDRWITINRQDEWNKTIPLLFNLPNQAVLDKVVLCHQEENLWCMSESSVVKQTFDKIFGCEQYKNEIKHIDAEIRASTNEISVGERDLIRLKERVSRKKGIQEEIEQLDTELQFIIGDIDDLERQIKATSGEKKVLGGEIQRLEALGKEKYVLKVQYGDLQKRSETMKRSLRNDMIEPSDLSEQDLKGKIDEHEKLVESSKVKQSMFRDCITQLKTEVRRLQVKKSNIQVKELSLVSNNLKRMSSIVVKMHKSEDVELLGSLIDTSTKILAGLVRKMTMQEESQLDEDDGKIDEIDNLDSLVESKNNEINHVLKEQSDLSDNLSRSFETHEEYKKNLALRDLLQQMEVLNTKILSYSSEVSDNSDKASRMQVEMRSIEKREMELREKRSLFLGKKSQIERELSKLKTELSSLSKASTSYAETLGRVTCNKIVASDLTKLKECFQKSVISFHDNMIAKINEVLRARWGQIYQGKDIETIELVDEEITRGKDKKYVNYYIALRKNGQRMKMREKSSAGQKALASIILRMTLAELFVKDFAFIALDEPTANLDFANIISLAKAIGTYVKRRSKTGANIQWIIITHDEQFLRALDADCSPYYYRTQLDGDGYSKIIKLSSRDVDLTNLPSQESGRSQQSIESQPLVVD